MNGSEGMRGYDVCNYKDTQIGEETVDFFIIIFYDLTDYECAGVRHSVSASPRVQGLSRFT